MKRMVRQDNILYVIKWDGSLDCLGTLLKMLCPKEKHTVAYSKTPKGALNISFELLEKELTVPAVNYCFNLFADIAFVIADDGEFEYHSDLTGKDYIVISEDR